MKNPLINIQVPKFNEHQEYYSKKYQISKAISVHDHEKWTGDDREFTQYGQAFSNLCGFACPRSVLLVDHGIRFSHEYNMINLGEDIYKFKCRVAGKIYNPEKHNIKENGASVSDIRNIVNFFDLGIFSSNKANLREIKKLLDYGINPIVFRPFDEKDREGHYIVTYAHDKRNIYFFDPAHKHRLRENAEHKGSDKEESLDDFIEHWTNKYIKSGFNSGYIFLYDKRERPPFKLDGYYMT